jgi:hypothetical protein
MGVGTQSGVLNCRPTFNTCQSNGCGITSATYPGNGIVQANGEYADNWNDVLAFMNANGASVNNGMTWPQVKAACDAAWGNYDHVNLCDTWYYTLTGFNFGAPCSNECVCTGGCGPTPPPPPPPDETWDCINGTCIQNLAGNGAYASELSCQSDCTTSATYNCIDSNIVFPSVNSTQGFCIDPGDGSGTFNNPATALTDCTATYTNDCQVSTLTGTASPPYPNGYQTQPTIDTGTTFITDYRTWLIQNCLNCLMIDYHYEETIIDVGLGNVGNNFCVGPNGGALSHQLEVHIGPATIQAVNSQNPVSGDHYTFGSLINWGAANGCPDMAGFGTNPTDDMPAFFALLQTCYTSTTPGTTWTEPYTFGGSGEVCRCTGCAPPPISGPVLP